LDNKMLYAGQSRFHFYLLLSLALGRVTRVRYTGATKLKILDLRPVQELLPKLGARMTIVEPHSNGLPVRVEASGLIPAGVEIPAGVSRKFILALITAAATFEAPLTIRLHESYAGGKLLRKGIAFLQEFLPGLEFDGLTVSIPAEPIVLDGGQVDIPIDPLMSLYLLVLPFFTDGQVVLRGKWPEHTPHLQNVMDILYEFGLRMTVDPDRITSRMGDRPQQLVLDITSCQEYLPLLLAMTFGLRGPCDITFDKPGVEMEHAQDLLEALGEGYSLQPGLLRVGLPSARKPKTSPWQSPGPYWTLAGSLVSFTHPGFCLANADNIASAWPWFWKIFMNLPEPQHFIRSPREDEQTDAEPDEAPRRRRIKVLTHE
jgi:3-phosphoshikimate 1-carboxyvinyltransferase